MMQPEIITYSKRSRRNMAFLFLLMAIAGAALALYMWRWADPVLVPVLVGGIFLGVFGIALFIKLIAAPRQENAVAITISREGIAGVTTPVARAAGLIEWDDIEQIRVYTRMLEISLKDPAKYAGRMTSFFVKDAFLKTLKGRIRIPIAETNATAAELLDVLESCTQQRAIRIL